MPESAKYTPDILRGEAAEAEAGHRIEDSDYPNSCCCVAADVDCLRGCSAAWEAQLAAARRLAEAADVQLDHHDRGNDWDAPWDDLHAALAAWREADGG